MASAKSRHEQKQITMFLTSAPPGGVVRKPGSTAEVDGRVTENTYDTCTHATTSSVILCRVSTYFLPKKRCTRWKACMESDHKNT